jgi:hypothetical protein
LGGTFTFTGGLCSGTGCGTETAVAALSNFRKMNENRKISLQTCPTFMEKKSSEKNTMGITFNSQY